MDKVEESRGLIKVFQRQEEKKIMIQPQTDIILGTVNKYNSKLLAFHRVSKSPYYMFKSTEISTFISPDYVFCLVLLFLPCYSFSCVVCQSPINYSSPSLSSSIFHAGGRTQQPKAWVKKGRNWGQAETLHGQSPTLGRMRPEKWGQTNSGFSIQPDQDNKL